MSARTASTSPSTSWPSPRTSTPRNGRTASNTTRTQRGSRRRWRTFTSSRAITISNTAPLQRNQTGETSALPSLLYVASTAGDAASSSGRTRSTQVSPTRSASVKRRRIVRRHLEVLQIEPGDVTERRRRDDAAEDRAVRLVDRDEDDELRRARRHDAHERRHVSRRRVPARRLGLRRRPRLPGHHVPGQRRKLARPL